MKTYQEWMDAYGESHQHPVNIEIHKIAVPAIMVSLLGMLWEWKIIAHYPILCNGAVLLSATACIFYVTLSFKILLQMLVVTLPVLVVIGFSYQYLDFLVFWICLSLFVVSWIMQFVGHKIEGKKPSFFEDLLFLLIGPLWVLKEWAD